jgi:LacI family transcriptional regulator
MAITMKDIARDVGLSEMTVSKVIRNHSDISEKTKKLVRDRIKELGYEPNWAARSLAQGRTDTIGLVVPSLSHPFFASVAEGLARKIQAKGYFLLITSSDESEAVEERAILRLLARQVDGVVVASCMTGTGVFQKLERRKAPYVLIDRRFLGLDANYVGANDEEIGMLATEHLIERGCRRIAHVRGPEISTGIGRYQGYLSALAKHGLVARPDYIISGKTSDSDAEQSGCDAMGRLLSLDPRPDGVFCYNDALAMGVMKAILEASLCIPADIAIVGAGNMRNTDLLAIPLSTIDQSSLAIGQQAGELVLKLIKAKGKARSKTVMIPPTLVARQSTIGPARS